MKYEDVSARAVRVSIPASVAADIGSLKDAARTVLGKLGCDNCCSGHNIFFELQRDVVLGEKLSARADLGAPRRAAAATAMRADRVVQVGINPEVVDNIDGVFLAIDRIAELTGHPACATGCDMFLQLERTLVLDAKLGIKEQVMTLG